MNKIINGKRYDTMTAQKIAEHSFGNPGDFEYCCETLYRKRTGEFFMHGTSGGMSKYRVILGQNQWSGGSEIIPLTYDEARKFAEENLSADEYEKAFGCVESDDDSKTTFCIWLPYNLAQKTRTEAAKLGMNLSAYIAMMLSKE